MSWVFRRWVSLLCSFPPLEGRRLRAHEGLFDAAGSTADVIMGGASIGFGVFPLFIGNLCR